MSRVPSGEHPLSLGDKAALSAHLSLVKKGRNGGISSGYLKNFPQQQQQQQPQQDAYFLKDKNFKLVNESITSIWVKKGRLKI